MIYFRKCLEKDATFYDENNPNEMAAKIAKEISAINRGLGEKIGTIIMSTSAFVFGFVFAFYWGWKLTLILMASFPVFMILGYAMANVMKNGMIDHMRAYT